MARKGNQHHTPGTKAHRHRLLVVATVWSSPVVLLAGDVDEVGDVGNAAFSPRPAVPDPAPAPTHRNGQS